MGGDSRVCIGNTGGCINAKKFSTEGPQFSLVAANGYNEKTILVPLWHRRQLSTHFGRSARIGRYPLKK
jgi:hypothetical protein